MFPELFKLTSLNVRGIAKFQKRSGEQCIYAYKQNLILYKIKKKQQSDCCYCHGIDQTPLHLFVECSVAKSFWNKFTNWYNATCGGDIALERNEIIYGVLRHTSSCLTLRLNHLIIIGKYFLYIMTEYMMKNDPSSQFCNPCLRKT